MRSSHLLLVPAILAAIAVPVLAQAGGLPANFSDNPNHITGLSNPTAMEFAPDGRLFVCQQGGILRVFSAAGASLGNFMSLTVDQNGERGLLGIAFDPNFASNHFLYVYRTVASTPAQGNIHNIVSRFTEDTGNPNRMLPGSEVIILELDPLSGATNHNGGAIHFGPSGKLYVAVGENANSSNAQIVSNRLGKILRINTDGTIPADNPTTLPISGGTVTPSGVNRAIWAMGFRNPFTFAVQPGTGRILINDVGNGAREEIDDLLKGMNYGWPSQEGINGANNAAYTRPLYDYDHTGACAITGGTFYNPTSAQFPASYVGKYFFQDLCGGFIRLLDLSNNTATGFATGLNNPVDLKVDSAGALYYLTRGGGNVGKITYSGGADLPAVASFTTPASGATVSGTAVAVNVRANDPNVGANDGDGIQSVVFVLMQGATVLANPASHQENAVTYDWTFDSTVVANGSYTIRATVTSTAAAGGTTLVITRNITISNTANTPPTPTIVNPPAGTMYNAGQTINYSGTATDAQDGTLAASRFTWRVDFHHDTHVHPFIPNTTGSMSGSFVIPTQGEPATNVWYRIYLTVVDSGGLSTTVTRDIMPNVRTMTVTTSPAGLQITVDGQPHTAPYSFTSVVGMERSIGDVSPQASGATDVAFASWSDGGAPYHTILTPGSNTTYTATYSLDTDADGIPDSVETAFGLNPNNPDQDGNGTIDGLDDWDSNSVSNQVQMAAGTAPGAIPKKSSGGGGGGLACGLTGLEGVIGLGLAAAFRRRRR